MKKMMSFAVIVNCLYVLPAFASHFIGDNVDCAIKNDVKVCVGDRTMIRNTSVDQTIYYIDVTQIIKSTFADDYYKVTGKLVGDPKGSVISNEQGIFKPRTGPVQGFPMLRYGAPVDNIYGSSDIVLHFEKGKYFVFLGDKGFAKPLTQRDLAERINVTLSAYPTDSDRGVKCPNFDGKYELVSCKTTRDDGSFFWPYSSHYKMPNKEVIVEQNGCDKVTFSFVQQWNGEPDVSAFSPGSSASSFYFDLTKGDIDGNSVEFSSSTTDSGGGWGSECFPIPFFYTETSGKNFTLSIQGEQLKMKAKFSKRGFATIIPHWSSETIKCELVRKAAH